MKNNSMKSLSLMLICTVFLLHPVLIYAKEPTGLYAQSAVLMDADSYRVLYGKNENEIRPMASTTKIMTLLITLENADLEDIVTVSENAAKMPEVKLHIRKGEQYYLKDLVYSMMLESHNDSAVAIAEHVGGSVKDFAKLMNEKANEIGCANTYFITPNGLDAEEMDEEGGVKIHATTARDLAKIMSYCVTNDAVKNEFLRITKTTDVSFATVDGKRSFYCQNHNAFLQMMDGVMSGKTGFTTKAGYCYVCAVESEGRHFVVALMACGWPNHKGYKWKDTIKLLDYGKCEYEIFDLQKYQIADYRLKDIFYLDGDSKFCKVSSIRAREDNFFTNSVLKRKDETVEIKVEQMRQFSKNMESNEFLGKIELFINGEKMKELSFRKE